MRWVVHYRRWISLSFTQPLDILRLVPELVAFLSILDDFYPETSGITLSCELVAGLTMFAAMPYILAVNPSILLILTKNSGSESCFMTRRYH